MPADGGVRRLRSGAGRRWHELRSSQRWLDHTLRGYGHYKDRNGDHLAAAITYFSFLAMFPLILLGVSVVGFVLAADTHLQNELLNKISTQAPGGLGDTLQKAVDIAINQRAAVGVIGLLGVALSGLGWIDNLRTAIDTIWGRPEPALSFVKKKVADTLVLLGLGLALVVSLGITAGGTAASHQVLVWLHADGITGMGTVTRIVALLLAIAGNLLIFGWIMIRLPDAPVTRATELKASLLAAVGFEILKIIGTYYIARIATSPAYALIGPPLGILIWINLVSRYLLFCVGWAATAPDAAAAPDPLHEPVSGPPVPPPIQRVAGQRPPSPLAVAAGLFSAGATAGAAATAALQARRSRARARRPPRR